MLVLDNIQLGAKFNDVKMRMCTIHGCAYASVLDTLAAISATPRAVWSRLQQANPELMVGVKEHQFPGTCRLSPVAQGNLIAEMILKLPGVEARKFSATAAETFLKTLHPTRQYIQDLKDRADDMDRESGKSVIMAPIFQPVDTRKVATVVPGGLGNTILYVRVRKPEEFLVDSTYKELTLDTLQFGVTSSVNGNSSRHLRNQDNGMTLFSFQCSSRNEAHIVEDIMKYDFSGAAVPGRRECVDTSKIAAMLECEFDQTSYSSYVGVGQQLYAYMLRLVHTLWSRNSHTYGNLHEIIPPQIDMISDADDAQPHTQTALAGGADDAGPHALPSFGCKVIDEAKAVELGLIKQEDQSGSRQAVTDEPVAEAPIENQMEHQGSMNPNEAVEAETADAETAGAARAGAEIAGAEIAGAETSDAETSDAETAGAEIAGAETSDAETSDAETADAETADAETADAETADAETADAETADAETADAETADAETADAETADAETADAETADAETADAETAHAKTVDAETAHAKTVDANTPEAKLNRFVEELCVVDPLNSASITDLVVSYQLWSIESGREISSFVSEYFAARFPSDENTGPKKNTLVNGIKLKPAAEYVLPMNPSCAEEFLFEMCDRGATYKLAQTAAVNEYKKWMVAKHGKALTDAQIRALKAHLKDTFPKTSVRKQGKDGEQSGRIGFFGLRLKTESD